MIGSDHPVDKHSLAERKRRQAALLDNRDMLRPGGKQEEVFQLVMC
jgi:hypothetical protein